VQVVYANIASFFDSGRSTMQYASATPPVASSHETQSHLLAQQRQDGRLHRRLLLEALLVADDLEGH